jgi:class 3 adenylate cyclase/predicted ATPase
MSVGMDVADWLRGLGLQQYEAAFRENDVGVDLLPSLTAEDLKDLGITPVGHRRRLQEAIAALRASSASGGAPIEVPQPVGSAGRNRLPESITERRQLSVMFCDLVGSTELSARLDPEDLGAVIRTYQGRVAEIVARSGGFIAQYLGDGVLIYFGWPEAREADAERAVRAALAVMAAVSGAPVQGERLQVRIGIATGLVVVGERIGTGDAGEQTAIGETPNRAARLQAVAEPNGVVIDDATRQQIGLLFELRDFGQLELKGLREPVRAWTVLGESEVQSRFEALRRTDLADLVGRSEEMALLLRRWEQARMGSGRVVLVTGEPGIGKSRLVAALQDRLRAESHLRLRHFCSPHHQDSALYPAITQIERACGFLRTDTAAEKLARLEALLGQSGASVEEIALIAALLSISTGERHPLPQTSPQKQREKTLAVLFAQLPRLAARQPVLLIYEDAHWIDPTTLELLAHTVERVASLPVLLLITARPEFRPPWPEEAHVTMLALNRLNRADAAGLVDRVTGGRALPDVALEQILARTDGIPLFLEELTKTLLESGLILEEHGRFVLTGPLPPLAIPATLHDSLLARLDRLGTAREVAQIGAVIGREFSLELLSAVAGQSAPSLEPALGQLVRAGLLFSRGVAPETTYTFKHALVQNAAYETLLRSRRQELHARIVRAYEERFPEQTALQPELIAHHCTQAGLAEKAIDYWDRAGQRAVHRSAATEATAHFTKALTLLAGLPEGEQRDRRELALQLALAGTLMMAKGWSSSPTGDAYSRARELCRRVGDVPEVVATLTGLFLFHHNRAEIAPGGEVAEQLLRFAEEHEHGAGIAGVFGHRAVGANLLFRADFSGALQHLQQVVAIYGPAKHHAPAISPYDPCVACRGFIAWTLLFQGYPDRALSEIGRALAQARALAHPHTLSFALHVNCLFCQVRGDWGALAERSAELVALAAEQGFPHLLATGTFFRGWAMLAAGEAPDQATLEMQRGLSAIQATGTALVVPYDLGLLADAHQRLGDLREARQLLTKALDLVERTGERWYEAELERRMGEVNRAEGNPLGAEQCFDRAMGIARRHQARLWELQAATSLSRLWRNQNRIVDARTILAPVYAWFTEGFDTVPLREAKTLLDELGRVHAEP